MRPVDDLEWIPVEEASASGRVRREAMRLADRLGFDEQRSGEVGLAATELASNLHRHAVAGTVVLRARRSGREAGVELVATDAGPGIADLAEVMTDGHSTAGTLGVGFGVVRRLASSYDAHSVPGRGTVVVATFWPAARPGEPASGAAPAPAEVGLLTRPISGEEVCGDAGTWSDQPASPRPGGEGAGAPATRTVMLVDGLGHGSLAATAADAAVRAFAQAVAAGAAAAGPSDLLGAVHAALGGTRGAAVSVAQVDGAAGTVRYAGVGNVAGWIVDGDARRGMVAAPGVVGHKRPPIRTTAYPLPPGALVVLHSDGLSSAWSLDAYPGLRRHEPLVVAATLMRDAGIRNDDASVLVTGAEHGPAGPL